MSRTTDYIIENDITFNDLESGESHSPTMQRIVIVEEYGSAYTLDEHGNLLFTPIGGHHHVFCHYSSDDDWHETDMELVGDEYDYDSIIDELKN